MQGRICFTAILLFTRSLPAACRQEGCCTDRAVWCALGLLVILTLHACSHGPEKSLARLDNESHRAPPHASDGHRLFLHESPRPAIVELPDNIATKESHPAFSISLDSAPVTSVLQILARDASINLSIAEGVTGTVSLHVVNLELPVILSMIERQLPLRIEYTGNRIQVFRDLPVTRIYKLDYLNIDREAESSVALSTEVGAISIDSTKSAGSGAGNHSSSRVSNFVSNKFRSSVEDRITALLGQPGAEPVSSVSVNPVSGLVIVTARQTVQAKVKSLVQRLMRSAHRQVLIEALIIEVKLSNEFAAGVDWRVLSDNGNYAQNLAGSVPLTAQTIGTITAPAAVYSLANNTSAGGIKATLSLLEQFGDVRILSSPKINALNNQPAVLKIVDNRVYFTVQAKQDRNTEDEVILTTSSELRTVPIGLVMSVVPYIDSQNQVMMNIRPTISRIVDFVSDPNPSLALLGVKNNIPEIQVKEMETVLKVHTGGLIVIGGLMQESVEQKQQSVPFLSRLPAVGKLFQYEKKSRSKSELIVLIKPTVVDPGQSHSPLYEEILENYVATQE